LRISRNLRLPKARLLKAKICRKRPWPLLLCSRPLPHLCAEPMMTQGEPVSSLFYRKLSFSEELLPSGMNYWELSKSASMIIFSRSVEILCSGPASSHVFQEHFQSSCHYG